MLCRDKYVILYAYIEPSFQRRDRSGGLGCCIRGVKHLIYKRSRGCSGERVMPTRNILAEIVQKVVEAAVPDKIILFGSRAKGEEAKDSDYDIFVLKSGVVHKRKLAQRIYLMLDVNVPVDVIVETPETFDKLKYNPFLIYNEIAKHGQVVYEK